MFCPTCKGEYREGFARCADCDVELVPELPPDIELSLEYIDLVNVKTYSSRHEAELAKGILAVNGITAVIFGDDCGGIHPCLSFSTGIKLSVKEEDVEESKIILDD